MNQEDEELDKYFTVNSVKGSKNAYLFDKKRTEPFRVSDKELAEGIYFWDPVLRQFIKFCG
jgi:hypothetical protein